MVDSTTIYIPDVRVWELTDITTTDLYDKSNKAYVHHNGIVEHYWFIKFTIPKNYNITAYPYDKYNIKIDFIGTEDNRN